MYPQIISSINEYLIGRKANVIFTSADELVFEGTKERFPWRHNIFLSIERGKFKVVKKDNRQQLTYKIYLDKSLVVFVTLFAMVATSIVNIWAGLGAILWLGRVNLLITIVRHNGLFEEVLSEITQSFIINESIPANEVLPVKSAPDKAFLKATGLAIAIILAFLVLANLI